MYWLKCTFKIHKNKVQAEDFFNKNNKKGFRYLKCNFIFRENYSFNILF